ncbi:MAG: hypothetical protein ACREKH_05455 [Candidatus Rokuibacteriota bacterium]
MRGAPRRVHAGDFDKTPVFWGERLVAGNVVPGPAIIQVHDTTIVVTGSRPRGSTPTATS